MSSKGPWLIAFERQFLIEFQRQGNAFYQEIKPQSMVLKDPKDVFKYSKVIEIPAKVAASWREELMEKHGKLTSEQRLKWHMNEYMTQYYPGWKIQVFARVPKFQLRIRPMLPKEYLVSDRYQKLLSTTSNIDVLRGDPLWQFESNKL